MPAKQTQLPLYSKKATRAKAGPKLAARMIAILSIRKVWTTRADFANHGLTPRECRLGRAASNGRIIRGQKGYILLKHAGPEAIRASLNAWQAQIQAEQKEYAKLCRRAHTFLHNERATA